MCENPLPLVKDNCIHSASGATACGSEGKNSKQVTNKISINEALKRPSSWSIRGVKIFRNEEIEKAVGLEKERRKFWNQQAKELSKITMMTKAQIYEKIHADWRVKKSKHMLDQGADMVGCQLLFADPKTKTTKPKVKAGTLENNMERVEQCKAEFTKLSEEVKKLLVGIPDKNTDQLTHLREKLALARSDLRKAQGAMRKTVKKLSQD